MLEELEADPKPQGDSVLQLIARPRDTNAFGDIYAGWLVDQMDQAAEVVATTVAKGRCATVSIDSLDFMSPIPVGAKIEIFAGQPTLGRSSITVPIEAWITVPGEGELIKVTAGDWVMVAITKAGHIRAL
ncbi:acyl-CoA thioesterase [Litorivicinus lipolyticus]|jgi:acyl-CoA thioesterase YciA|uniref:Acyl-CoA thioesterase n=1 Tax=Litorivicinus lipolyticus TaxID=418701 RepID=A0A5Q2QBD5_9GAMM|nr:hotdog domain-containing protein [Litorivicinus lipolyticus]QGG79120.1 acyl-CoA thioesterase [Litorivicinus lipolyticus]